MSFNLAIMLQESVTAAPSAPMLYMGDATITYREVDDRSRRVATALRDRGLQPGDKVAVQVPNVPEFVYAYFGILRAGLTMVPLNPLFTAREMAYHLDDSDTRLLITSVFSLAGAAEGAAEAGVSDIVVVPLGTELPDGSVAFDSLLDASPFDDLHPTSADDTAVLLYTSGTTGRPKGAELTHYQLYMNCTVAPELFGMSASDVSIGVLPLFHVFGLSSVLNATTRWGASVALLPRFDATAVIDEIERRRATVFAGVPTMYVALAEADATGRDLSTLRAAVSGGASIPGEVIKAVEAKFTGLVVLEGYGLSETASTTTFNVSATERKVLSIGKPVWGVEMKVIDDEGNSLSAGADNVGQLLVRGHNIMKGYYKRPDATADALRNGWLHTGDLGYRDDEGYYFVVDRLKDMIVRGGYNVYPREIEEVLYSHPDVVEAAVIGTPDDRLGEEVVAYVAVRDGADLSEADVITFAKEQLAAYKYPRSVVFVAELPKGATGKILKRELRTS